MIVAGAVSFPSDESLAEAVAGGAVSPRDLAVVAPGRADRRGAGVIEKARVSLVRFRANEAIFAVEGAGEGDWLFYADAFHPNWTAVRDGKPVPVARAWSGYKAVPLEEGSQEIGFRFANPWLRLAHGLFCANALFLLAWGAAEGFAGWRGTIVRLPLRGGSFDKLPTGS